MNLLRAFDPALYDLIQQFRFTDDTLMPWAYQTANPQGRPLHNDWGIMGAFPALQPFQKIPRIECAYRMPLPFKQISGQCNKQWMLWDPSYPASPGLQTQMMDIWDGEKTQHLLHALVDQQVEDSGWATFAGWINGKWVPCFSSYRAKVIERRFAYYKGLKMDVTVMPNLDGTVRSDIMAWFPEISTTWNKL